MVNPDPALMELPYYHPNLTDINQVCDVLTPYIHQDGTFLLRDSQSRPGKLTISVMHQRQVNHFNVEHKEGRGYLLYEIYFKAMRELIEYYKTTDIPNRDHVNHIRLTKPVYSTRHIPEHIRNPALNGAGSGSDLSFRRQQSLETVAVNRNPATHAPRRASSDHIALPLPPNKKKTWLLNLKENVKGLPKTRSQSESSEASVRETFGQRNSEPSRPFNPADRPAPPIPDGRRAGADHTRTYECNYRPPSVSAEGYNDPQENIYTQPREEIDQTETLVNQLRMEEDFRANIEMCHCGIRVIDSDLPQGWSVHRSQEPQTRGRLFFVSAENMTSWTLPRSVQMELTPWEKQTLARLREEGVRPGIYRFSSRDS